MKNILTLIFLLCSLSAFCQTTVTKTFVLGSDGITYYEVTTTTDENGNYHTDGLSVGPLAGLAADQADKIEAKILSLAQAAYTVSYANKDIKVIEKSDSLINAIAGVSPLKKIQDRYQAALLTPGWTIDQGAGLGFQALVFTINAQGNLRYSIAGAATKPANVYGAAIRLNNYPSTGINTDFWLGEDGKKRFSLPNRGVIIKGP